MVISLICLSGGIINPVLATFISPSFNANSNTLDFLLFYGIAVISTILLVPYITEAFDLVRKDKFIAILLCVSFLSSLWSDVPFLTFRKTIGLCGTAVFGLYFAIRYTLEEQLNLLAIFFIVIILSSFIVGFATPCHGFGEPASILEDHGRVVGGVHEGAWRGVFYDKNLLGAIMVLSSFVFLLIDSHDLKIRIIKWTLLTLSLALLLLSHSQTSLITLIFLLLISQLYKLIRITPTLRIGLLCLLISIIIIAIPLLFQDSGSLLGALGRNPTLSGRTELWIVIISMIKQHPILGYGYNSVWIDGNKLDYIQSMVNWPVTHSHNGYLDLWLQLGVFGLSAYLIGFLRTFCVAIHDIEIPRLTYNFWPLIYFSFLLIYNLTETAILTNNSIFWALYVASTMSILIAHSHITSCAVYDTALDN